MRPDDRVIHLSQNQQFQDAQKWFPYHLIHQDDSDLVLRLRGGFGRCAFQYDDAELIRDIINLPPVVRMRS